MEVSNSFGTALSTNAALTIVTVAAWGNNAYGQTQIPLDLTNAVAVSGGLEHSLALRGDGTVAVWGRNNYKQTEVPAGLSNVIAIAAGNNHNLALKADGTVVGWGANMDKQASVPVGLTNVTAVAAGADHSLALKADGTVAAWGSDYYQQVRGATGVTHAVAIAAGSKLSLAVKADGTLAAWGAMGIMLPGGRLPLGMRFVAALSSQSDQNSIIKSDGRAYRWNLGDTNLTPVGLPQTNFVGIAAGSAHYLVLRGDGTVLGIGDNHYGQAAVPADLRWVAQVKAGANHSLALINPARPVIWSQPFEPYAYAGASTELQIQAFGGEPLSYQWQLAGADLPGATDSRLLLEAPGPVQAGIYRCIVRNGAEQVISREFFLQVLPQPAISLELSRGAPQQSLLTLKGDFGRNYCVRELDQLGAPGHWRTFTNLTLATSAYQWIVPAASPARFYRAVLIDGPRLAGEVFPLPDMVWIEPGSFVMGSPANEAGHSSSESPQTQVTLTRGFYSGRFEVTQKDYLAVASNNPSVFKGDLSRPVDSVSFSDALNYCALLTERERAAGGVPENYAYRLPTEAEWEYIARAGTSTRYSFGDDPQSQFLGAYAWVTSNSGNATHPVGVKNASVWDLCDLAGNVAEWCTDFYAATLPGGQVTDPTGPTNGVYRVVRGGAYNSTAVACRSAARAHKDTIVRDRTVGFRVVLAPRP